jgi:pimeloyl-ACP methyl ester carboxylesterase
VPQKKYVIFGKCVIPHGDLPQDIMLSSMQALAQNVQGITIPLSGHWIPEERPDSAINQLYRFFGNSTMKSE